MPEHSLDLAALKARSQELLIGFLETELALGFTFLQTAAIEAGSDSSHRDSAIEKAHAALQSIRTFQGRVQDDGAWSRINDRANILQADLNAFEKSG